MPGHERLVGRHDRRALPEQPRHDRARGFNRVQRLDDDIVMTAKKSGRVGRNARRLRAPARFLDIANERLLDVKADAGMRRCGSIGGKSRHSLANAAEAENADANGPHGGGLRLSRADAKGPMGRCGR